MKLSEESCRLFEYCVSNNLTISCCESMSSGLLANNLVLNEGASQVFVGGVLAYHADIKNKIVGIDSDIIHKYGTVSSECCCLMASKIAEIMQSKIGLSITGNAGAMPIEGKLRGGYYVGCFFEGSVVSEYHEVISDSRKEIMECSVVDCLRLALKVLGIK